MLQCVDIIKDKQLLEIESLLQACKEHDGNSIPIYKHLIDKKHPIPCNILYYLNQQLVGYLRSFFFYADACEIALMVLPKYRRKRIATQLIQTIIPIMQREGIKKLIFSTPAKINDAWLKKLGLQYRNSEYHMQYNIQNSANVKTNPAKIRFAKKEDIPIMCIIDNAAFPNKKEDPVGIFNNLLKTKNCDLLVLEHDDKVVAKAHIFTETDKIRLTDIGVLPEYRALGFGKSLVKHCINHCLVRNKTNIVLDVESKNASAINLYLKLGFKIINTHDYWATPENNENYGLSAILNN